MLRNDSYIQIFSRTGDPALRDAEGNAAIAKVVGTSESHCTVEYYDRYGKLKREPFLRSIYRFVEVNVSVPNAA